MLASPPMSYVANLRTFVRVYELGSMSAAGRDQRVSAAVASFADRRARATPRSAPLQPHHPKLAAHRAGRDLLQGRAPHPRNHRGGRGRGRRRLAEPARLAARRGAARDRQAADRAARPGVQGPLPRDRRPPAPLGPPGRPHRRRPRHGLRPRRPRGLEPPGPPDRRLPPPALRRPGLPRQPPDAAHRPGSPRPAPRLPDAPLSRQPASSSGRSSPPTARAASTSPARSSRTTATS